MADPVTQPAKKGGNWAWGVSKFLLFRAAPMLALISLSSGAYAGDFIPGKDGLSGLWSALITGAGNVLNGSSDLALSGAELATEALQPNGP